VKTKTKKKMIQEKDKLHTNYSCGCTLRNSDVSSLGNVDYSI